MNKITFIATFLMAMVAQADQCAWNDKSAASVARAYLAYKPGALYSYCEPCGDSEMKSVFYGHDYENTKDQRSIHFRWVSSDDIQPGETGWELVLNEGYGDIERKLDLAYVFEKTDHGYVNIGAKFNCTDNKFWNPTKEVDFSGMPSGVSPFIPTNEAPPVVKDVSEGDFMDAHLKRYPSKPQG